MKILTLARDLRRRRARERQGLFVAEGVRLVEELLRSEIRVRGALVSPALQSSQRGAVVRAAFTALNIPVAEVGDAEFASAADTDTPQGVLVIAEVPGRELSSFAEAPSLRLLVLDAVQDPGNVGTMLRTAAALGASATVALPGTVDLWNAKVVRSAMGAHFHHPALSCTWDELDAFRHQASVEIWGADAAGVTLPARPPARVAIVVGNEANGLSPHARERADRVVRLAIAPAVESLNVAVAAGILLYELNREPSA